MVKSFLSCSRVGTIHLDVLVIRIKTKINERFKHTVETTIKEYIKSVPGKIEVDINDNSDTDTESGMNNISDNPNGTVQEIHHKETNSSTSTNIPSYLADVHPPLQVIKDTGRPKKRNKCGNKRASQKTPSSTGKKNQ
ncbi:hypothetical protein ACF0H5_012384 [Mactra antiquata]